MSKNLPPVTYKVIISVSAALFLIGVVANMDSVAALLQPIFRPFAACSVTVPATPACVPRFNPLFMIAVTTTFLVVAALIVYSTYETVLRPDLKVDSSLRSLRRFKDRLIGKIERVVSQAYFGGENRFDLPTIQIEYDIDEQGSAKANHEFTLKTGTKGAYFWRYNWFADDTSSAVENFDRINFSASAREAGQNVDFLLMQDDSRAKKAAIFFLPEVPASEQRTLSLRYEWPQYFRDLVTKGRTIFHIRFETSDAQSTSKVSVTLKFAKGLGDMRVIPTSALPTSATLNLTKTSHSTEWTFTCPALPLGGRQYAFEVVSDRN